MWTSWSAKGWWPAPQESAQQVDHCMGPRRTDKKADDVTPKHANLVLLWKEGVVRWLPAHESPEVTQCGGRDCKSSISKQPAHEHMCYCRMNSLRWIWRLGFYLFLTSACKQDVWRWFVGLLQFKPWTIHFFTSALVRSSPQRCTDDFIS